jgi:acyl-CoA thioesterase I
LGGAARTACTERVNMRPVRNCRALCLFSSLRIVLMPSRRQFLLSSSALGVALLLPGCSKVPRLNALTANDTVLAFGDSLTFGTGASPGESYPARLAALISRKVINAGVPGEISAEGLKRLPEMLEEHRPRLLLLCHGGNDFLRKLGDAGAEANIRSMVALARAQNAEVALLATPKPGLPPSVPGFYPQIAKDNQLPIEADVLPKVLRDNSLKSDLVHPNASGYALVAESMAALLKKAGAV